MPAARVSWRHRNAADDGHPRTAGAGPSGERRVTPPRSELGGIDSPRLAEVEDRDVGGGALRQASPWQVEQPGWARGEARDERLEVDDAGSDQSIEEHAHRRLEADDTVGGIRELVLLLGERVGRMVGCDAVDRAIRQRFQERLDVPLATEWR